MNELDLAGLDHFALHVGSLMQQGIEIRGTSPIGRVTARVLAMNEEMRQMLHYELWREECTR